jgi:hypothetical protein
MHVVDIPRKNSGVHEAVNTRMQMSSRNPKRRWACARERELASRASHAKESLAAAARPVACRARQGMRMSRHAAINRGGAPTSWPQHTQATSPLAAICSRRAGGSCLSARSSSSSRCTSSFKRWLVVAQRRIGVLSLRTPPVPGRHAGSVIAGGRRSIISSAFSHQVRSRPRCRTS